MLRGRGARVKSVRRRIAPFLLPREFRGRRVTSDRDAET
jgi:hypothetical protein